MNTFDGIPEDDRRSYPCPMEETECPGNVTENKDGNWECDTCDFISKKESNNG